MARRNWQKWAIGTGVAGLVGLAFCVGRMTSVPQAAAAPTTTPAPKTDKTPARPAGAPVAGAPAAVQERPSDYSRRVVAYHHGTIPITREDLGEYLIARQGAEKLELLVNRRIIEQACKEKGIVVSGAEVEATFADDLKELKLPLNDFKNRLLKEYRKTLYEWKEDVVWPKIALTKLCRDRVKVEPRDLSNAFEAYYGERV